GETPTDVLVVVSRQGGWPPCVREDRELPGQAAQLLVQGQGGLAGQGRNRLELRQRSVQHHELEHRTGIARDLAVERDRAAGHLFYPLVNLHAELVDERSDRPLERSPRVQGQQRGDVAFVDPRGRTGLARADDPRQRQG